MGVLTLVDFVKEKYGIPVEDDELLPENWYSVNRIASFIQSRIGLVEAAQHNVAEARSE
jgi:acyl carrier protein